MVRKHVFIYALLAWAAAFLPTLANAATITIGVSEDGGAIACPGPNCFTGGSNFNISGFATTNFVVNAGGTTQDDPAITRTAVLQQPQRVQS